MQGLELTSIKCSSLTRKGSNFPRERLLAPVTGVRLQGRTVFEVAFKFFFPQWFHEFFKSISSLFCPNVQEGVKANFNGLPRAIRGGLYHGLIVVKSDFWSSALRRRCHGGSRNDGSGFFLTRQCCGIGALHHQKSLVFS